jgi:hypothetical protein
MIFDKGYGNNKFSYSDRSMRYVCENVCWKCIYLLVDVRAWLCWNAALRPFRHWQPRCVWSVSCFRWSRPSPTLRRCCRRSSLAWTAWVDREARWHSRARHSIVGSGWSPGGWNRPWMTERTAEIRQRVGDDRRIERYALTIMLPLGSRGSSQRIRYSRSFSNV